MAVKAQNVQFSGVMPGGHASGSFEVEVENAYLMPPPALREGAWVVIYDDAHELFEGEVLSVKPTVEGVKHKLMVELGGMMSVAGRRGDVVQTWVHRGGDGWRRRAKLTSEIGSLVFDDGIDIRVPLGSSEDFRATTMSNMCAAAFYLDDMCSDATISYVSFAGTCDLANDSGGQTWSVPIYTAPDFTNYTLWGTYTSATTTFSNAFVPPDGAKQIMIAIVCNTSAHTVSADHYIHFSTMDIFSSGRTTKARIDEAMVALATRPGIALSYTSQPVGPQMDDLRVGSASARLSVADSLQEVASYHAQPFDWGFWDNRSFDVRPRLWTPDNDSRVIVVGGGRPGLVSWDVAEYDEDVPDYACVIYGNKDTSSFPEAWPRRVYRPSTPPDDNVKLVTLDYSSTILSDAAAAAIGDNIVGRAPTEIPPDYIFRVHPHLAKQGIWPGNNVDPTSTVQEISDYRATGTTSGIAFTSASGWSGSNSPADPACLTFDGTSDYVSFGDLAQLDLGAGARTVTGWFKVGVAPSNYVWVFNKQGGSTAWLGWNFGLTASSQLTAQLTQNSGATQFRGAYTTATVSVGVWYHGAAVYAGSGGDWTLYLNGTSQALTATGAAGAWNADNSNLACLGGRPATSDSWWSGSIGEVLIYPRALSAAEVAQIYNAGQVYYKRNDAKGTAVIEGMVQNRKGALVPAHHVRAGWWIQHTELGDRNPLYITGHSVSINDKRNNLTIGQDWMEEEIGVRTAELLALPPTPEPQPGEADKPPWWGYLDPWEPTPVTPPGGQVTPGGYMVPGRPAYNWSKPTTVRKKKKKKPVRKPKRRR